jgi:hypothetical protein
VQPDLIAVGVAHHRASAILQVVRRARLNFRIATSSMYFLARLDPVICRILEVARSSAYYREHDRVRFVDDVLAQRIKHLIDAEPYLGYRMVWARLLRAGVHPEPQACHTSVPYGFSYSNLTRRAGSQVVDLWRTGYGAGARSCAEFFRSPLGLERLQRVAA